jgi:hypothetical protein
MNYRANCIVAILLALFGIVECGNPLAWSQEQLDSLFKDPEADKNADHSLTILKQLITSEDYFSYGLKSADELREMKLGEGVPVFYVYDNDLKEFSPSADPSKLIRNIDTRVYPVTVRGEGRILITMRKQKGEWQKPSFGQQDIAANLTKITNAERELVKTNVKPIAIQIPTMHLTFATFDNPTLPGRDSSFRLIPLNSREEMAETSAFKGTDFLLRHPQFNPSAKGSEDSKQVFAALAAAVKSRGTSTAPE